MISICTLDIVFEGSGNDNTKPA